jgi:hypothetical protein
MESEFNENFQKFPKLELISLFYFILFYSHNKKNSWKKLV